VVISGVSGASGADGENDEVRRIEVSKMGTMASLIASKGALLLGWRAAASAEMWEKFRRAEGVKFVYVGAK
jgi:hypothetical protein